MLGIIYKKPVPVYLFGGLSLLGFGFTVISARLKPVYAAWLKVAHFIGKIITTSVLIMAYYLVITPFALIKKLFGGYSIFLKPDPKVLSYWVSRTEPVQPKERFIKRF